MNLKEIGEFGFIKKISRDCLIRPDHIIKGIGDDAAAFITDPGYLNLITTDLLVERIHFLREAISGFDLGYKSLAVNLSDIAAMGGVPRTALSILKSKLEQMEQAKQDAELAKLYSEKGEIAWGNQIRSYVLHGSTIHVKDHRTNLAISNVQRVLDGDIQPYIDARLRQRLKKGN